MPDFAAEGLLDGLSGDERDARLDLLEQLSEAGVSIDDLRRAVAEQRLPLLPVELVLSSGRLTLSARELAERTGLDVDFILEDRRALGLTRVDPDEKAFDEGDVEAAQDLSRFVKAGLDPEGMHEVARVVGEGMARVAGAVGDLVGRAMLRPGDTERDLGMRYAEAARSLSPVLERQLGYVFKLQLREHLRNEIVGQAELETGKFPGSATISVCFADLVGFTKLGEELPPDELGRVAGRLSKMAADVASSPVKLVKTIGDAAMLVSTDTAGLLDAALELVRQAEDAGDDFPLLRAGISRGEAVGRGGDWYGRPVNVASRVTAIARPGSVLATEAVRDAAADAFEWSVAGRRRLKGVKQPVPLFRARRPDAR
ncbi:MAG: adenylate cyclase [Thermoleophilaceae bacterium]